MVPVKSLGELRWYLGCFHERDGEKGGLKNSQQTFAEQSADEYIQDGKSVPLPVGTKLARGSRQEGSARRLVVSRVGRLTDVAYQPRLSQTSPMPSEQRQGTALHRS